jgi:hypothetical protein
MYLFNANVPATPFDTQHSATAFPSYSMTVSPRYDAFVYVVPSVDPDHVAAGHAVRFRRAAPGDVVRSERPAHPGIISVADFTQVQLLRRAKARGGSMVERAARRTERQHRFQGMIRCALCGHKMDGASRGAHIYYRCLARTCRPKRGRPTIRPRSTAARMPSWSGSARELQRISWLVPLLGCQPRAIARTPRDGRRVPRSRADPSVRSQLGNLDSGRHLAACRPEGAGSRNSTHVDESI